MNDYAIQTHHLTRCFGSKRVVHDLNLTIPRGSVFALLGRNGSGKTTTLRMLLGLLRPSYGSGTILGFDSQNIPPASRADIGYLAEGHPIWGRMRVKDAEKFQARSYPKWNAQLFHSVLEMFRVDSATTARNLSRGERAGLCLAMVLATEPRLLILDDPALGLDPVARRALLESVILATRNSERTIVFSSHVVSDIERLADTIAVLDYSVLRAQCSLETFRSCVQGFVLTFDAASPPAKMPEIPGLIQCIPQGNRLRLVLANVTEETRAALHRLGTAGVEEMPITLEDAMISYLGGTPSRANVSETSATPKVAGGVS